MAAAGLDIERWEAGRYPIQLMNDTVAWYRLHNLVVAHTEEATTPRPTKPRR